jgi:hypothetical protein
MQSIGPTFNADHIAGAGQLCLKHYGIARLHFYGDLCAGPVVRSIFWRTKDKAAFGPKRLLKGWSYAIAYPTNLSLHFRGNTSNQVRQHDRHGESTHRLTGLPQASFEGVPLPWCFQRNASLRSRVYGSPRGVSIEVAISDEGRHLRHFGSVLSRSTYPPTPEVRQRVDVQCRLGSHRAFGSRTKGLRV